MTQRKTKTAIEVYRRLREVWRYDSDTGVFTRQEFNVQGPSGFEHGFINAQGYRSLALDNVQYPAARMAWLYMKAKWPEHDLLTRNGDKLDLRIANLYERPPKIAKKGRENLTQARLHQVLEYEPLTGNFKWLIATPRAPIGAVAGVITNTGYRVMSVDAQKHLAHRLVWFYVHGKWPEHQIDHINGNRADNRLSNLREATPGQNAHNAKARSTNKSGLKGVSLHRGRWHARIVVDYKMIILGYFPTKEAAHAAYCVAAKKYHGEFANNGSPQELPAPKEAG